EKVTALASEKSNGHSLLAANMRHGICFLARAEYTKICLLVTVCFGSEGVSCLQRLLPLARRPLRWIKRIGPY
ncbi:hypothetical protein CSUI_004982, partial [Cystoisospora suis]